MSIYDDLPSDSEPCPTVRAKFLTLRQRIARFGQSPETVDTTNVVEFEPRFRAHNQVALDLANAFRSTEAAGKYDPLGGEDDPKGAA